MTDPIRVAVLGFSAFERNAITAYFGLDPRRTPSYQQVLEVDEARVIVADADQAGVVALLRSLDRTREAVFVGTHGPPDAGAWMMRPINPAHLLRELDALVAQLDNPGSGPLPLPLPSFGHGRGQGAGEGPAPGVPGRRAADEALGRPDGLAEARRRVRAALQRPTLLRRALLVDDSEIALHFLRRQLVQYGLDTDFARHSARALELLAQQPYGLVMIDVDLGEHSGSDGLTLCQQIRHHARLAGEQPLVAMVSAFHDPVDQVRGTLAGADAYLGKPLDFGALDRLLQAQGLRRLGGPATGDSPGR